MKQPKRPKAPVRPDLKQTTISINNYDDMSLVDVLKELQQQNPSITFEDIRLDVDLSVSCYGDYLNESRFYTEKPTTECELALAQWKLDNEQYQKDMKQYKTDYAAWKIDPVRLAKIVENKRKAEQKKKNAEIAKLKKRLKELE